MTTDDKEMWRINIENDTDMVCYEEVFGDLELMINDD